MFDGAGDTISEVGGSGIDTVRSSLSFSLLSAAVAGNVENVTLTGNGNINATGNALANTLVGNSGDNRLDGGLGGDTMIGGAGRDLYIVDSAFDRVDENAPGGGGIDQVNSSVTFNLRGSQVLGVQEAVENLRLTGTGAINGFGSRADNVLIGNGADNALMGLAGNDTLTGGGGADTFMFHATLNAVTNVDEITDFNVVQDTMRLENLYFAGLAAGALDPDAFHIGPAALDAEDRIIYRQSTGALYYDPDGFGGVAGIRFATLDAGLSLTSSDFAIV